MADAQTRPPTTTTSEGPNQQPSLVFTYGTLKRGFPNHGLIQDIITSSGVNDAVSHLGTYTTLHPYPLVIGPHGIPFLIGLPGQAHRVTGDLYSISTPEGLARVDELEGTSRGHYDRLPIKVVKTGEEESGAVVEADAFFADKGFGERLWEKAGRVGLKEYGAEEAKKYVKPKDRPTGSTFLGDVIRFLDQ